LGINDPVPVQYIAWEREILNGNMGFSMITGRPDTELIADRLPATVYLMGVSTAIATILGITGGIIAAIRKNTIVDYATLLGALGLVSVPSFFIALLAIYVFGLKLGWLPTAGINVPNGGWGDAIRHLILPAGIMGIPGSVGYIRWARSS